MDGKQFRTGSITVLFVVIMLCVAVLAALTVSTAVSDRRTAERYGDFVRRLNECENDGELWLAAADAYLHGGALPENTELSGSELQTELNCDNMTLTIRLGIENSSYEILEWNCRSHWQPEEEEWNLWRK